VELGRVDNGGSGNDDWAMLITIVVERTERSMVKVTLWPSSKMEKVSTKVL
jgi:hypothetical protein